MEKTFSVQEAGYTIKLTAQVLNRDLVCVLSGGDVPHLGSCLSYDYKTKKRTNSIFASHHGRLHKDSFLAERFADKIIPHIAGNLVVTAGVHVDGISEAQIAAAFSMVDQLAQQLASWLKQNQQFKTPKYTSHLDHQDDLATWVKKMQ